jgi:hypothetical protein
MSEVISYRTNTGVRVRAVFGDDDMVDLTYSPGSMESSRQRITAEQVEDAVAVGRLHEICKEPKTS